MKASLSGMLYIFFFAEGRHLILTTIEHISPQEAIQWYRKAFSAVLCFALMRICCPVVMKQLSLLQTSLFAGLQPLPVYLWLWLQRPPLLEPSVLIGSAVFDSAGWVCMNKCLKWTAIEPICRFGDKFKQN